MKKWEKAYSLREKAQEPRLIQFGVDEIKRDREKREWNGRQWRMKSCEGTDKDGEAQ